MRLWCHMLENHEPLEALFREGYAYDSTFTEWIKEHRSHAFASQLNYLERVFQMIEREQSGEEVRREELEENERHSLEWCQRFHVPTFSSSLSTSLIPVLVPSVEGSHSGLPVSFQSPLRPDVEKDDLLPSDPAW